MQFLKKLVVYYVFLYSFICLAVLHLCCAQAFSSRSEQGLLCSARPPHRSRFPRCGAWALECRLAPRHVATSRTRDRVPCLGRWILNHLTVRILLKVWVLSRQDMQLCMHLSASKDHTHSDGWCQSHPSSIKWASSYLDATWFHFLWILFVIFWGPYTNWLFCFAYWFVEILHVFWMLVFC